MMSVLSLCLFAFILRCNRSGRLATVKPGVLLSGGGKIVLPAFTFSTHKLTIDPFLCCNLFCPIFVNCFVLSSAVANFVASSLVIKMSMSLVKRL